MAPPVDMNERVGVLEAGQRDLRSDIHQIQTDVRELRNELAGRPSWAVTTVVTLLTGACASLATALITVTN